MTDENMEKILHCHKCGFYCDLDYNKRRAVCPECGAKMYLVEGTPKEIDDYLAQDDKRTLTSYYNDWE